ncbi:hypothetical protein LPICM02_280051 [Pseudolactococcus piscium]|nr:hypothetical protein LPICM02_280051 [Lactococcus piscium]
MNQDKLTLAKAIDGRMVIDFTK